jgi:ABC-type branched-subunit amino acid transport system substrate-binding protein
MSGDPFVAKTYANVFPTIPPYSYQAMYMAQYAVQKLNAKKIALLYQNDDVGQAVHQAMANYVKSIGAELVADVPHAGTDTDYTPMAQKIAAAKPDAVVAWGYPTALIKGKASTMAMGVNVPWFGAYFNATDSLIKLDPAAAEGLYFNYYLTPFFADTPDTNAFKAAMKRYFPDVAPSGLPLNGYAACQVFLEAFKEMTNNGGAVSWERYIATLNSFATRQVGVVPGLTYTKDKHTGPGKSFMIQWKDGKWNQLGDASAMPSGAGS